jgi:hypothetical protein
MKSVPKAFLTLWLFWLLAVGCFGFFYRPPAGSAADFRSLYAAGYLAAHHPGQLYSLAAQEAAQSALDPSAKGVLPFVHLSYEALLYAPFTVLSYQVAYTWCLVVNLLLLMASFLSARGLFSRVIPLWQPRPGLALFVFLPVFFTLLQGQDSLLLLLICCLTLGSLLKGRPALAGAILALALFKFQIALPLVALLAVRRGWRVLGGFVPVTAVLVAGSLALAGTRNMGELRALLIACTLGPDAGSSAQTLVYVHPAAMPNLMGLVFTLLGSHVSGRVTAVVVAVLSLATLGWSAWRMRRMADESEAFGIAILATVLVSYHLYLHDATLLLIPLALWGERWAGAVLIAAPVPLMLFGASEFCWLAVPVAWLLVDGSMPGLGERLGEKASSLFVWKSGKGGLGKATAGPSLRSG